MQQTILSNGAQIATRHVAGATTAMVAIQLVGGARAQHRQEAGFAHLAEHVLMAPSAPTMFGAADQAELFARWGGEINGYSGREHIALVGHVRPGDAAKLAAHFVDRIMCVEFDAAVLRQEVARLAQESSIKEASADDMEAVLFHCLWPDHPLNNPRFPDSASSHRASPATLCAFWQRVCAGPGASLLAVGAVDHAAMATSAARIGLLPAAPGASMGEPWRLGEGGVRLFQSVSADAEGRLIWILPANGAAACAEFLLHLLCGTQQGELHRVLRDGGLHFYGLDAAHLRYSDAAVVAFAVGTTAESHEDTKTLVERHLSDMVGDGLAPARFETHRTSWATRQLLDAARLEFHLEQLAHRLKAGAEAEADAISACDFAGWLSPAWQARVILDWPPGGSGAPRDPRNQTRR